VHFLGPWSELQSFVTGKGYCIMFERNKHISHGTFCTPFLMFFHALNMYKNTLKKKIRVERMCGRCSMLTDKVFYG